MILITNIRELSNGWNKDDIITNIENEKDPIFNCPYPACVNVKIGRDKIYMNNLPYLKSFKLNIPYLSEKKEDFKDFEKLVDPNSFKIEAIVQSVFKIEITFNDVKLDVMQFVYNNKLFWHVHYI